MTKQEEIREGVKDILKEFAQEVIKVTYNLETRPDGWISDWVKRVESYLHSQGVVIKVNRRLPTHLCECCEQYDPKAGENYCLKGYCGDYGGDSYKDWKFAGYVAVEPLIKE